MKSAAIIKYRVTLYCFILCGLFVYAAVFHYEIDIYSLLTVIGSIVAALVVIILIATAVVAVYRTFIKKY